MKATEVTCTEDFNANNSLRFKAGKVYEIHSREGGRVRLIDEQGLPWDFSVGLHPFTKHFEQRKPANWPPHPLRLTALSGEIQAAALTLLVKSEILDLGELMNALHTNEEKVLEILDAAYLNLINKEDQE